MEQKHHVNFSKTYEFSGGVKPSLSIKPLALASATAAIAVNSVLMATNAQASNITFSTGYYSGGPQSSAIDYKNAVNAAVAVSTPGYGSTNLSIFNNVSNQSLFGSYDNIAYKSKIDFSVASDSGPWSFRFGVDFGYGGAVFLDGVPQAFNNNDMWWDFSYSDPNQYFAFTVPSLSAGIHSLTIYGLEWCCDGPSQAQFLAPGATDYTTFSSTDGLAVPEPFTILGAGTAIGFGASFKRKLAKKQDKANNA